MLELKMVRFSYLWTEQDSTLDKRIAEKYKDDIKKAKSRRFKNKKSCWLIVMVIVAVALIICPITTDFSTVIGRLLFMLLLPTSILFSIACIFCITFFFVKNPNFFNVKNVNTIFLLPDYLVAGETVVFYASIHAATVHPKYVSISYGDHHTLYVYKDKFKVYTSKTEKIEKRHNQKFNAFVESLEAFLAGKQQKLIFKNE